MVGGFLVYKCRMCGEEFQNVHAPDAFLAMMAVMGDVRAPKTWCSGLPGMTTFHHHQGQLTTGLADFIGVLEDKPQLGFSSMVCIPAEQDGPQ